MNDTFSLSSIILHHSSWLTRKKTYIICSSQSFSLKIKKSQHLKNKIYFAQERMFFLFMESFIFEKFFSPARWRNLYALIDKRRVWFIMFLKNVEKIWDELAWRAREFQIHECYCKDRFEHIFYSFTVVTNPLTMTMMTMIVFVHL